MQRASKHQTTVRTTTPRKVFDWSFWLIAGLTAFSAAVVWRRDGFAMVGSIFAHDLWQLVEILPKVAAGMLIGEFVRRLVPREVIVAWLGERSGLKGLLIASLIGCLFPAGPFTIFPLAGALLLAGADRGAAIAFISAWLLIGLSRMIVWELPFLGGEFVLMRALISLWMPVALGLLARLVPARLALGRPTDPPAA